ncbi:tRNA lysidine(34) synthetase TilS [Sporolactobacillus sp. THM7-7]|nr:tRNA lysidine(34) synthetase TilS [Sporolactobacillus sp. THM7-7]
MTFDESVTQFIKEHSLIHPRMRLVAGVSGGADSMALILYLLRQRGEWALKLAVCSVNHGLRGAAGKEDLDFVAAFCRKHDISFYGRTVNVPLYMKETKMGGETAARQLRYRMFAEAVRLFQADALVLAHHGDDQIETMLMGEVRGNVGLSRAGIPVSRPFAGRALIRPFLSQTKAALETYCAEHGIHPRSDTTNESDKYTRNRFRKQILPFLKQENPSVHLKFQYASERIADDERFLMEMAAQRLDGVVAERKSCQINLSVPDLLRSALPLQRRILHLILSYLYKSKKMQSEHHSIHIEQLLRLMCSDRPSGTVFLPGGLMARKSYERCLIGFFTPCAAQPYDVALRVPGKTSFAVGTIDAQFISEKLSVRAERTGPECFIADYHCLEKPLRVRTRLPGDRMWPSGMAGSQKVQRLFINHKIDRRQREIWPLVVDGKDHVLWLPYIRRGRIPTPATPNSDSKYLKLTYTPTADLGGQTHEGRSQ